MGLGTRGWPIRLALGAVTCALVWALAGCDPTDPLGPEPSVPGPLDPGSGGNPPDAGGDPDPVPPQDGVGGEPDPAPPQDDGGGDPAPLPPPPPTGDGRSPSSQFLPAPTGACPAIAAGDVTFAPAGIPARKVRIWVGPAAATRDGPLVFYWHGTGSSPNEAVYGLGQPLIDEITGAGGIVAAPYSDPAAGTFPWFLTTGRTRMDDLLVADEVLACARRAVGVDVRRIHGIGMSAGGLQTAQMSYRRSGYLASVATYSGGLISGYGAPARQDPTNRFAALIFHGGSSDVIFMGFQAASEAYWSDLDGHGHFAAICDHGGGHSIPTDARASVGDFFAAHPFGVEPSPYTAGLPSGFPSYCSLAP